jgi:hypothetical protein
VASAGRTVAVSRTYCRSSLGDGDTDRAVVVRRPVNTETGAESLLMPGATARIR